jgi:hypothetical protein
VSKWSIKKCAATFNGPTRLIRDCFGIVAAEGSRSVIGVRLRETKRLLIVGYRVSTSP